MNLETLLKAARAYGRFKIDSGGDIRCREVCPLEAARFEKKGDFGQGLSWENIASDLGYRGDAIAFLEAADGAQRRTPTARRIRGLMKRILL